MLEHILEGLVKAGWVIIPLMLASLIGWYIVFERAIALAALSGSGGSGGSGGFSRFIRPHGLGGSLVGQWRRRLAAGDWETWVRGLSARQRRTVVGNALSRVYAVREAGREAMEAHLDEVMKFRIPELEKSLSTLAILASAAPLMGLLGTVAGIVRTFQVISAFGTGNQALMSDSIAESLMATQNGLLVAFPLLLMHVHLSAKAEAIEKDAMAAARSLLNRCARAGGSGPARNGSFAHGPVPALGYSA